MIYQRFALSFPLVLLFTAPLLAADPLPPGLVAKKPASGRFVKTDKGYMVPYQFRMPGGEAVVDMVPIPGGIVHLGSPSSEAGRRKDEGPQVRVRVQPFWMAKTEVTWTEYKQFMALYEHFKSFESEGIRIVTEKNKVDAVTAPTELYDPTFTFEKGEEPQQPAVTMTPYAAKQYTKWLTAIVGTQFRLPSEAEWEHACRAGAKTAYHFGDSADALDDYAWHKGNSSETTHLVAQKKPNAWGLYDMHGNVAELVLDQYEANGHAWLAGDAVVDAAKAIKWPTKAYPRLAKGGSWSDDASGLRAAARLASDDEEWKSEDPNIPLSPWWFTSDPSRGVGFRLLRPLHELPRKEMKRYWEVDHEDIQWDVDARLDEGRGALGLVDPKLPEAIEKLNK